MINTSLSYPTWHLMELMATRLITWCFLIGGLALVGLVFTLTSITHRAWRRGLVLGFAITLLTVTGAGLGMHAYVRPYLRLSHLVTPRIRVARPEFGGLVPETGTDIGLFSRYNDYPDLDRLPMYTRQSVRWPVTYYGRNEEDAYFVLNQYDRLYDFTGAVRYTDTKQPYLLGYAYALTDQRYAKLGFINPTKLSTVALVLPKAMRAKGYSLKIGVRVYLFRTGGLAWTDDKVSRLNRW